MSSNNYGVRITDVVMVAKILEKWDFTKYCSTRSTSVGADGSFYIPDLPDFEGPEPSDFVQGSTVKRRISHFAGEVAAYDFGNGNCGLSLKDKREAHFFVCTSFTNSTEI